MKKIILILLAVILAISAISCKKDNYVTENVENLFRPAQSKAPDVISNTVKYYWYGIADATSYLFQLSRGSDFSEIEYEKTVKTPEILLVGLSYNTTYYARVKALAAKSEFDSKWNSLDRVTTEARIVPVVLKEVEEEDITSNSAILKWDKEYYVTRIVVSGTGLSTFRKEVALTDGDRANGYAVITGLEKSTSYQAVIYDDTAPFEEDRSYNVINFRTQKFIPEDGRAGGRLMSINEDLIDAINAADDGSTLILPRGYRYTTVTSKTVDINKDICILSARQGEFPLEQGATDTRPFILISTVSKAAQVNLMPFHISGKHTQIRLEGIDFQTALVGKNCCLFFIDKAMELDYLILENCSFRSLGAGVCIIDSSEKQVINNIIFRNNLVDDCATNTGYKLFTLCSSNLSIGDFDIEKSILSHTKFGLVSNYGTYAISGQQFSGHINITLKQCTLCSLFGSRNGGTNTTPMFDMQSAENVIIKFDRCLLTRNGNANGTNLYSFGNESTLTAVNCRYTANDFSFHSSVPVIPAGMVAMEGKAVADVIANYSGNNYTITDGTLTAEGIGCSADWSWVPVN